MEKIVIFGSTGVTGICATEAAVKKGLQVRALVRDPLKVADNVSGKIEIVTGNVLNYEDVLEAVQGTNAVVVALGTRNNLQPTTDMSNGLKNIIKAMKESKIEVVSVCLSAFLFPEMAEKAPAIFKDITDEHRRMLDVLKESNLKYIAVFPPHIADNPPTGYKVEHDKYLGRVISKFDLGNFLVNSLEQSEHYRKICGIISS